MFPLHSLQKVLVQFFIQHFVIRGGSETVHNERIIRLWSFSMGWKKQCWHPRGKIFSIIVNPNNEEEWTFFELLFIPKNGPKFLDFRRNQNGLGLFKGFGTINLPHSNKIQNVPHFNPISAPPAGNRVKG